MSGNPCIAAISRLFASQEPASSLATILFEHYSALSCPAERNAFVIALIGELLVARCAPNGKRTLSIIDAANIPRIDDARKIEMLSIFADGYFRAQEELRRTPQKDAEESGDKRDPHQPGFFDEPH